MKGPALPSLLLAIAVLVFSTRADALCPEHPFSSLGDRLARVGEPVPLALLGGAILSPLVLAPSGADQRVRELVQGPLGGRYNAERISVTAPYALASALAVGYVSGLVANDCTSAAVAARSLQAMGIAFLAMSVSKYALGRTYPAGNPYAEDRLVDDGRSRRFDPFGGAGAWPSGHAATTFAFAAVLRTTLPPRAGAFRYAGYALATLVSLAMIYGDHHWTSDVVSGALLGEAVGGSVGAPLPARPAALQVVPSGIGFALIGTL